MRRIAIILVFALAGTACGAQRNQASGEDAFALGDPAPDGQFTFTVSSFECGEREVARGLFSFDAVGVYCIAEVRVANTGDAGRRFVATAQRLTDADERVLELAQRETLLLNDDAIGSEINPGLALDVVLVWDVADPGAIRTIELHDSPLSGGVHVSVEVPAE